MSNPRQSMSLDADEGCGQVLVQVRPGGDGASLSMTAKGWVKRNVEEAGDILSVKRVGRAAHGFDTVFLVTYRLRDE